MNRSEIVWIKPPMVILKNGKDVKLQDIKGSARIGATLDLETMEIVGSNVDPDCVGGACPIK